MIDALRASLPVRSPSYFFPLLFLLIASPTNARVITMQSDVQYKISASSLEVTVKLTNKGDEAAKEVSVVTQTSGSTQSSRIIPSIAPGATESLYSQHPISSLLPGHYPLQITTHYADANGYAFSALNVTLFQKAKYAAPGVTGFITAETLRKKGKLTLNLKNLDGKPHNIRIRLILPGELTAEQPELSVPLAASQETSILMRLTNFSALAGSTYVIYAIMEYEEAGFHYTSIAPGRVAVEDAGPFDVIGQKALPLSFAALVIGLLIAVRVFWATRKKKA